MRTEAVETARVYYDRDDVDGFYRTVWGGEDIHIGLYADAREAVATAARRTVLTMAGMVSERLGSGRLVLDMGSGYGGPARTLVTTSGCRVTALNISAVQNRRHREINVARGLGGQIDIVTASFEELPFRAECFDVVWSQDALSHSDDQAKVLREAARVLAPTGHLIFTDLMAADDLPGEALRGVIARTGATSLPTPSTYRQHLAALGFTHIDFVDHSDHLLTHYEAVAAETRRRAQELADLVGPAYLDLLLRNLPLWVQACREGRLRWGVFHCKTVCG